jgi:hypothetical protein
MEFARSRGRSTGLGVRGWLPAMTTIGPHPGLVLGAPDFQDGGFLRVLPSMPACQLNRHDPPGGMD